jgi:hypothetical protein
MFGSSLSAVVCRRALILLTMFGLFLPPVVCSTTADKDEPNIVNKIRALLQTTGGKDEPNIVNEI